MLCYYVEAFRPHIQLECTILEFLYAGGVKKRNTYESD